MEVKENQIIKELRWLSEKMFGKQKAYYDRMLADATPIRITPLSEVFDEETIKLIKTQIRPEPKLCFKNATMLYTMFPDRVKYVEGRFTVCGCFSTEHAWNKIGDKYIDITMEIALERNPAEEEYIALGEYEESEILTYLFESKVYGGIYKQKFLENYGKDLSNKR